MSIIPPGYKACFRCGVIKPFSDFRKRVCSKDGLNSSCKTCISAVDKLYRENNPEKVKAAVKKCTDAKRATDPEIFRQRCRNWYEREGRLWHAQWRSTETGQRVTREVRKRYYESHTELCKQANKNRAKSLRKAGGTHTKSEWLELCKKHNYRCLCCGAVKKLTKDHILPVTQGGTNDIRNIQPLCVGCNSRKGQRHIVYRTDKMLTCGDS